MLKDNYWIRSGLYSVLQRLSIVLFGFGSFTILVRVLPKEDFGVYALFITLTSLMEVARMGLIQNGLIKFLASAEPEEQGQITSSSIILNITVTLISLLILIALAPLLNEIWNTEKLAPMLYLYTLISLVLTVFHQLNFIQQAKLDFSGLFWSNFIRQGSFFTLLIIYLLLIQNKPHLNQIVILMLISTILGTIVSYKHGKKYLRLSRNISWIWIKKLFNYGKFVFGTNISSMVFGSVDKFMLGSILSTVSVAVFSAANRVNNLIEIPTAAAASIAFPQIAKKGSENNNNVSRIYEKSVGILVGLLLPVILIILLFADIIIIMITGNEYSDAANILRVIAITGLLQPFIRQFGTVLDSIGKPKLNFYLILFFSIINAASNYFFITIFSTIGAAIATLFTTLLFTIVALFNLKKLVNVNIASIFTNLYWPYKEGFYRVLNIVKAKNPLFNQ